MTVRLTTYQRAAQLPAPKPGQEIVIPLELWPAYKELHGLEAMNAGEIAQCEKRSPMVHKAGGPVWVKRATGSKEQ
jgi:hypothetical protein